MPNESKFMTPDDLTYYDGKIKERIGDELAKQKHKASDINSGTFSTERLPVMPIAKGGTNADTANAAQFNLLGSMSYVTGDLTDDDNVVMTYKKPTAEGGVTYKLKVKKFWDYINAKIKDGFGFNASGVLDVAHGGTASTNAADARSALDAAAASHVHNASDITNGVLDVARIPVDSTISATSVNPVQNKVVQEGFIKKQDKLVAGSNITIDPGTNVISVATSSTSTSTPLDKRLHNLDTSVSNLSQDLLSQRQSISLLSHYLDDQTQAPLMNQRVKLNMDITEMFDNGTFSAMVANGTFDGLALGQYIQKTIDVEGIRFTAKAILCDANYCYGPLNSLGTVTTPHVACIVDIAGLMKPWGIDSETSGGYAGSNVRDFVRGPLLTGIKAAFGENHMVRHGVNLSNAVQGGHASNWSWFNNSYGEIMNAAQCYGLNIGNFYDVGEACHQLALFQHVNPQAVVTEGSSFWLRDIKSAESAFYVTGFGSIGYGDAGAKIGVVPLILLK